jgi:hypothetical protein
MGKPFERLKYKPPEAYRADGLIQKGEAISIIADLLVPEGDRNKQRRKVKDNLGYAIKTGKLFQSVEGALYFNDVTAWATQRYGSDNPDVLKLPHNTVVKPDGVAAVAAIGDLFTYTSRDALLNKIDELNQEVTRLRSEAEENKPFIETGTKLRKKRT